MRSPSPFPMPVSGSQTASTMPRVRRAASAQSRTPARGQQGDQNTPCAAGRRMSAWRDLCALIGLTSTVSVSPSTVTAEAARPLRCRPAAASVREPPSACRAAPAAWLDTAASMVAGAFTDARVATRCLQSPWVRWGGVWGQRRWLRARWERLQAQWRLIKTHVRPPCWAHASQAIFRLAASNGGRLACGRTIQAPGTHPSAGSGRMSALVAAAPAMVQPRAAHPARATLRTPCRSAFVARIQQRRPAARSARVFAADANVKAAGEHWFRAGLPRHCTEPGGRCPPIGGQATLWKPLGAVTCLSRRRRRRSCCPAQPCSLLPFP